MSSRQESFQTKSRNGRRKMPVWIWIGLAVFALVAFAAIVFLRPAPAAENLPPEVTVSQAAELRNSGAYILDVREPVEWQEVHIPDAAHIPLAQLTARLDEIPREEQIVVICRSGNRSAQGRDILLEAGYENVTSVAGGMNDWQANGFPVVSGP